MSANEINLAGGGKSMISMIERAKSIPARSADLGLTPRILTRRNRKQKLTENGMAVERLAINELQSSSEKSRAWALAILIERDESQQTLTLTIMANFLKIPDSEFHAFQNNFLNVAIEESLDLRLAADDLTPLSAVSAFNGGRRPRKPRTPPAAYQTAIRELVARLQTTPAAVPRALGGLLAPRFPVAGLLLAVRLGGDLA